MERCLLKPEKLLKDPKYTRLQDALIISRISHRGQFYNNSPYFHHPIRVLLRTNWWDIDDREVYAILFHDLFEDTDTLPDDLRYFGFDERTIHIAQSLTRREDESYKEYIQRLIALNDMWILRVKLCDLYENSNNVRFLPPEKRGVMVRYGKSIEDILNYLNRTPRGRDLVANTISGELDRENLEAWIGQPVTFL